MEFRQLEIFIAVVETGSFSRAGERLFLSQPAVTAHMSALEKEMEQQLLVRTRQGVHLTDGGKLLYGYAVSALNQREQIMINMVKNRADTAEIRIAASSVPAQYVLPELLASFRSLHREVRINLIYCDSLEVGRKLAEHQADVGFSGYRTFDTECEYLSIAQDRLAVITPVTAEYDDIARGSIFSVDRLLTEPMISRESGSGTRREFTDYLQKARPGAAPNIIAVMEDYLAIKNAVAAGMGISVMSERAAADYARLGYIRSFPLGDDAVRDLYIMRRKKARLMGLTGEFFQFVTDRLSR